MHSASINYISIGQAAQYAVKQAYGHKEEIQIKSGERHLSVFKTWRGCTAHK